MRHRATVIDVNDPEGLGRIRARVEGLMKGRNETPWAFPSFPFAGDGHGFFFLPEVESQVWIEQAKGGDWVYTGFIYSTSHLPPAGGSPTLRILRTPAGHQMAFDEEGSVEIAHASGSRITIFQNGDVSINIAEGKTINLGGAAEQFTLLGEAFQQKFNDLVELFNSHTHQVPQSSSGVLPSRAPTQQAAKSTGDELSRKVRSE